MLVPPIFPLRQVREEAAEKQAAAQQRAERERQQQERERAEMLWNDRTSQAAAESERQKQALENEIAGLQDRLRTMAEDIQHGIERGEADRRTSESDLLSAQAKADLQADLRAAEREAGCAKELLDVRDSELESARADVAEKEREVLSWKQEAAAAAAGLAESLAEGQQAQRESEELQEELCRAKEREEELAAALKEARRLEADQVQRAADADKEISGLRGALGRAEAERARLSAELAAASQMAEHTQREGDAVSKRLAQELELVSAELLRTHEESQALSGKLEESSAAAAGFRNGVRLLLEQLSEDVRAPSQSPHSSTSDTEEAMLAMVRLLACKEAPHTLGVGNRMERGQCNVRREFTTSSKYDSLT